MTVHPVVKERSAIRLRYELGLPVEPVTLGIGLFLFADLLFFFALMLGFLYIRCSSASGSWPQYPVLSGGVGLAVVSALALSLGSFSLTRACRQLQQHGRRVDFRQWLVVAFVAGVVHLGLAVYQVKVLWRNNIVPSGLHRELWDHADASYVSAVTKRLVQLEMDAYEADAKQVDLEQRASELDSAGRRTLGKLKAAEAERHERQEIVEQVLDSAARWTSNVVANSTDLEVRRAAMQSLAYDIFRYEAYADDATDFQQAELVRLEEQRKALEAELAELRGAVDTALQKLRLLQDTSNQLTSQSDSGAAGPDGQAMAGDGLGRISEIEKQIQSVAAAVTARQQRIMEVSTLLAAGDERRMYRLQRMQQPSGWNLQYPWLRLPVSIPGGLNWACAFFLLTGIHALQIVICSFVVGFAIPLKADKICMKLLRAGTVFWHILGGIWICFFPLLYL